MYVFTCAGVLFLGILFYAISSITLGSAFGILLNDSEKEGDECFYFWIAGVVPFVALLFIFLF